METHPEKPSLESIYWKPEYSTGNIEVDLQHQYFIQLVHRLNDELNNTTDKDYHNKLLWELKKYVDFHFQSEENILQRIGVKNLERLSDSHSNLSTDLAVNIQSAMMGMTTPEEIVSFLAHWFINHTVYEDREIFRDAAG